MPKPLKPFKLGLPHENADHYVELTSGRRFARVSTILSHGTDQETIKKYHAKVVGEDGYPDYERAAFLVQFSCLYGTLWHNHLYQQTTKNWIPVFDNHVDWAYPELRLINWEEGYAGTTDLLYKSDGEVILRDYKTHSRFKSISAEEADVGVWEIDRSIQPAKLTKWRKQLVAYVRAVKSTYGIDVDRVEIICKNIHTEEVTVPIDTHVSKLKRASAGFDKLLLEYQMDNF